MLVGEQTFKSKASCEKMVKEKIYAIGITQDVCDEFLYNLIKLHCSYSEKTKNMKTLGITTAEFNYLRLAIYNHDGTETEISWRICIYGPKSNRTLYIEALRTSIDNQVQEYRKKYFPSKCNLCDNIAQEVDHIYTFKNIVQDFERQYNIIVPTQYTKTVNFRTSFLENEPIHGLFTEFHKLKASYRPLCRACNVGRNKIEATVDEAEKSMQL